tara:strand:+ start:619 stop:780 length:162 start_codon:yes stop_codon:yes gene_type:complete
MIVKIKYKNKKVYQGIHEVIPPPTILNLLMGKGEFSSSYVQKSILRYVRKNNK